MLNIKYIQDFLVNTGLKSSFLKILTSLNLIFTVLSCGVAYYFINSSGFDGARKNIIIFTTGGIILGYICNRAPANKLEAPNSIYMQISLIYISIYIFFIIRLYDNNKYNLNYKWIFLPLISIGYIKFSFLWVQFKKILLISSISKYLYFLILFIVTFCLNYLGFNSQKHAGKYDNIFFILGGICTLFLLVSLSKILLLQVESRQLLSFKKLTLYSQENIYFLSILLGLVLILIVNNFKGIYFNLNPLITVDIMDFIASQLSVSVFYGLIIIVIYLIRNANK